MPARKAAPRSLKEYQAKRDFTATPEPSGKSTKKPATVKATSPFFCVQKHLASHLHYDFRLEHRGVLLSWAVPKGPSLNPADKRLAMRVEDHPLDYGGFEGVIPSGYGAGIVMLWDVGTWEPEGDDVDAALEKGDLKIRLNGVKLKGSFVLVRTRGGARGSGRSRDVRTDDEGQSRSWLLIKHKDEWAGPVDVTAVAPDSVKSFGDLVDILAADHPDVWESHQPAAGGEAGKMLTEIIAEAARRKLEKENGTRRSAAKPAKVGGVKKKPKTSTRAKTARR